MPKVNRYYRVILKSEENLTDQEFAVELDAYFASSKFTIIEAVNLEGMKGEEDEISGNI